MFMRKKIKYPVLIALLDVVLVGTIKYLKPHTAIKRVAFMDMNIVLKIFNVLSVKII